MKCKLNKVVISSLVGFLILTGCSNKSDDTITNKVDQQEITENNKDEQNIDNNAEIKDEEIIQDDITLSTEVDLSQQQKNSIAMLNYLAVTSSGIENSKDSRLYLEEVYSSLINNTNPDKIDKETQDHIITMLDIIEDYRMISVKRDRLQYLYNQDKANILREAMPNPLAVFTAANAINWKRMIGAIAYTAIDSYNNYKKAESALDKQFLMSGWELDDEESANIHKNRKRTFNYMINIVRNNNLSGNLTMNEESVNKFVEFCNEDNIHSKIQFLESNIDTYGHYTNYWLELVNSYYEVDDYNGVLNAADEYNNKYTDIFRKDYVYASVLPKVIYAAQKEYNGEDYIKNVDKYCNDLVSNTKSDDWASRYFAAQVYMDLYTKTNEHKYLNNAYNLVLDNVNLIVSKQKNLNNEYLSDVKEIELEPIEDNWYRSEADKKEAKAKYKEEKKRVKELNKSIKEKRKTELPPIYEPLVLNCELLFGLADKLEVSDKEKMEIIGILETKDNGVFISEVLNDHFSFRTNKSSIKNISLGLKTINIPALYLTENSDVVVNVGNDTYDKWTVQSVKRNGDQLSDFEVTLYNSDYEKRSWQKGETLKVSIVDSGITEKYNYKKKVSYYKDYFLLPDKIEFE